MPLFQPTSRRDFLRISLQLAAVSLPVALFCATPRQARGDALDPGCHALWSVIRDQDYKVPEGFQGAELMDPERIDSVHWVQRPIAPRVFGAYRVDSADADAATLAEAGEIVRSFVRAYRARRRLPVSAEFEIAAEIERAQFFEFLIPTSTPGRHASFRVWKSGFFRSNLGWRFEPDGLTAGPVPLGTLGAGISAMDLALLLQFKWWERNRTLAGAKVLALPEAMQTDNELLTVSMPVTRFTVGDFGIPNRAERHTWSLTFDPSTGRATFEITRDLDCSIRPDSS